jgi:signal transduction histidine kinase
VSKIKSGSLVLQKTLFNISDLVNEVIEEISHINPQHQITFDCQIQAKVYADSEKISQVLINFLNNAIKYSPNSLKINVYTELDKDKVKVAVVDNGIGLIEADRKMVFERFYRVEGKNEKTFSGFGIGLFIASEIIRKHDGEIAVDSVLGDGSTFYFKLPIKK